MGKHVTDGLPVQVQRHRAVSAYLGRFAYLSFFRSCFLKKSMVRFPFPRSFFVSSPTQPTLARLFPRTKCFCFARVLSVSGWMLLVAVRHWFAHSPRPKTIDRYRLKEGERVERAFSFFLFPRLCAARVCRSGLATRLRGLGRVRSYVRACLPACAVGMTRRGGGEAFGAICIVCP